MKPKSKKKLIKNLQKATSKVNNLTIFLQNWTIAKSETSLLSEGKRSYQFIHFGCTALYIALVFYTFFNFGLWWCFLVSFLGGLVTGTIEKYLLKIF